MKETNSKPFPDNLVLIGMFGSGKSTVGRILANRKRYNFVDVDHLIEMKYRKPLGKIYDQLGMKEFMRVEEETILTLRTRRCILAPGGSAVYYPKGMRHLKKLGTCVYLRVSVDEIKKRLPDWSNRGAVCRGGNTIPALYRERTPLYRKYADHVVDASGRSFERIADRVLSALGQEIKTPKKK